MSKRKNIMTEGWTGRYVRGWEKGGVEKARNLPYSIVRTKGDRGAYYIWTIASDILTEADVRHRADDGNDASLTIYDVGTVRRAD